MKNFAQTAVAVVLALALTTVYAWDPREVDKLHANAETARAEMLENDPSMQRFFDTAAAWVIIPTVGKGGLGIGGARGKGLLYEASNPSAVVTLTQLTFGFQWGGQAYSEFIFFQDNDALENFKRGNYELGAQASAVAITVGASVDASYDGGVAIFTQAKGGLMYEASVGGQKFKVEPREN